MKILNIDKISFLLIVFGLSLLNVSAQEPFEVNNPDYIKSVRLLPVKGKSYFPLIKLGDKIHLSFDDLRGGVQNLYYKIEHCDYNWKKSRLSSTEYLKGYSEDNIRNYDNSFNTLQLYTHYSLTIPNNRISIKLSGNYLISVFSDDGSVIFTRRFMVYEPKVGVNVSVHKSSSVSTINSQQNIKFSINTINFIIDNPLNEIKIAVYKNDDWNTMLTGLKPRFITTTQLIYNTLQEGNFNAGNEFLNFDNKNLKITNNYIKKTYSRDLYNTVLFKNEMRNKIPYTYFPDINGEYVSRAIDSDNSATDADYSWVHFSLASTFLPNKKVYVYGAFNNWKINTGNKMSYDAKLGTYKAKVLLKQGFYNYKYVTVDDKGFLDENSISGNFYETENDYRVLVYYKKFGSRYYQLIGFGISNSTQLKN